MDIKKTINLIIKLDDIQIYRYLDRKISQYVNIL